MLDAEKSGDYLRVSSERQPAPDARSSKGKTTDSDSVNRGSNPRRASIFCKNTVYFQCVDGWACKSPPHFTPHCAPIACGSRRTLAARPAFPAETTSKAWKRKAGQITGPIGAVMDPHPTRQIAGARPANLRVSGNGNFSVESDLAAGSHVTFTELRRESSEWRRL